MATLPPSLDVQIRSVLVATDLTATAEKPIRHAIAVARLYGARFYLLHVVSSRRFELVGPAASSAGTACAWKDARQPENRLFRCEALADRPDEFLIRQGNVWEKVEDVIREKQVDLLIIGTHGRRGLSKLLLGSVAEQMFRNADCPVLTVGPGSFQDPTLDTTKVVWPFLFATDFGAASLRALPYAASFANRFGAKLVLLHVIPPLPMSLHRATAYDRREEPSCRYGLLRLRELAENTALEVKSECMVVHGSPGAQILQVAENLAADAIIMGLRRSPHAGTASHTLWSTAYQVVRSAACPVMTVRS